MTVVVTLALLPVLLSKVLLLTMALLVYVPVDRGYTTIVTVAFAALAKVPSENATVLLPLHMP